MSTEVLTWGPRDYVALPEIPDSWLVADVGPGAYPLKRANVLIDRDPKILEPLSAQGRKTIVCDINKGFVGIPDKSFDYVWASHILEHLDDVTACAAALSRIAKSGTIVMPSAIKDGLFFFEEKAHQWHVLPNPLPLQPPIFVRHNRQFVYPLEDETCQSAMCFLFRTGSNHDCTAERNLRAWYQSHEQYLDIAYHWKDNLSLIVIG